MKYWSNFHKTTIIGLTQTNHTSISLVSDLNPKGGITPIPLNSHPYLFLGYPGCEWLTPQNSRRPWESTEEPLECLRDNNSPIGGRIRENHPKRTADGIISISISAVHNQNFLNWKWCYSDFSEIQHRIIIYCVHVCYQTNVSSTAMFYRSPTLMRFGNRLLFVFMFFLIVDVNTSWTGNF